MLTVTRGGSRILFRRVSTRLLLYFNTNKPHSFVCLFFCRIPVVLENSGSSQGVGGVRTPCALHLDPPLVTDVSATCAVVIFRVKVSRITSVDGIKLWLLTCLVNRPLPSSKNPHFQTEAKRTTFLVEMSNCNL